MLCIDLFCGLGGWAEGFLAEGYDVIGFDIERHEYWVPELSREADGAKGTRPVEKRGWTQGCAISLGLEGAGKLPRTRLLKYPGQLVLQDVLTLHGSQFRDATVIVASPPCQEPSKYAMPFGGLWREHNRMDDDGGPPIDYQGKPVLNYFRPLFNACFRIQREASEAAGRYVPLVVENVCGAQRWVGRAKWHFGSFYLWGDVPVLMPTTLKRKNTGGSWFGLRDGIVLELNDPRDMRRNEEGEYVNASAIGGWNHPGKRLDGVHDGPARIGRSDGTKQGGEWWHDTNSITRKHSSSSSARKQASAEIAKIPFDLANYIARVYKQST